MHLLLRSIFDFKKRPKLRMVFANTGWLISDKIVRIIGSLFVSIWIARYLGPDNYGILNYAIAFVALFSSISTLGLERIVVRDIVFEPAQKDTILGTAFGLRLIGGVTVFILSLATIFLIRPGDAFIQLLIGINAASIIVQSFDVIDLWFQSQIQSKYTICANDVVFLVISIVKIGLVLLNASLIAFVVIIFIEAMLSAISFILVYRIKGFLTRAWKFSFSQAKKMLNDSWPLILSGMVVMIYMRIDQVMLANLRGDRDVGIYSAALKLSEFWYFIPGIIISSVSPSLMEAAKSNQKLFYLRLEKLFTVMSLLAYSIAIPLTFLSSAIVNLSFGKNYSDAGIILAIHIWTGLFVFIGVARGPWIIAEGLTRFTFITTGFGAVINVTLNLFFIPKFGGVGAAVSTVISQFFAAYFANILYPKTRKIFIYQTKALLLVNLINKNSRKVLFGF